MSKERQHTIEHVVFLGESGFPKGLAAIQRMTLMAKALLHENCKTRVLCRKGVWEQGSDVDFSTKGIYEGIEYQYTSSSVFRPSSFVKRNIEKIRGLIGEFSQLRHLKQQAKLDIAIVSTMSALHMFRYCVYGRILRIPVVLNFVEMASAMQDRSSLKMRINDAIFDKWIIKMFNAALPISDKLLAYYDSVAPLKPKMKLPILCDFEKFNIPATKEESYFLYCGSMAYREVIDFVLEAYRNTKKDESTKLYMIVSGGSREETQLLEKELNQGFDNDLVRLFSNIPYGQLVELYTNAKALLIPLRPTVQDASRFPHKIGEYVASGNPVITTDVGEIKNYFEDGKTALIAKAYSVNAFSEKMEYVVEHPEEAKTIGLNGKELGLLEFDYKAHGKRILDFCEELKSNPKN